MNSDKSNALQWYLDYLEEGRRKIYDTVTVKLKAKDVIELKNNSMDPSRTVLANALKAKPNSGD